MRFSVEHRFYNIACDSSSSWLTLGAPGIFIPTSPKQRQLTQREISLTINSNVRQYNVCVLVRVHERVHVLCVSMSVSVSVSLIVSVSVFVSVYLSVWVTVLSVAVFMAVSVSVSVAMSVKVSVYDCT